MKHILLFAALLSPTLFFGQKMLPGDDWCQSGHSLLSPAPPPNTADMRSDSIDITHTAIDLNLLGAPLLSATCTLSLQAKVPGVSGIRLDLEGLTVDSVFFNNTNIAGFSQAGASLNINLGANLPMNAGSTLKIVYHGAPVLDATGWGGVYNQSGYTYNLGVGFAADPHSFGRAWFPCFDNFVERCTFTTRVLTPANKPAYCNGARTAETTQNGNLRSTWQIDQPIPSYLACFAAGPYVSWKRTYSGIPVEIAAAAADTNKVRTSYQHLPEAIACFQHWYGPYQWPKIGYSLVPFNSGAMEHATNITIMKAAIDGSLNYETLWAHEFSHHWWGDLATCTTPEDMWLNEGWASYSEHLFTEWVYGAAAYRVAVRDNFLTVLQNAHVNEGGYRAVSGVPHSLTYGDHVYHKGAVVAHNLRGYLGDSLFQVGIRAALAGTNFQDWSSEQFRDKLTAATGHDLTDFFNDWVFNPGFSHFSVDSIQVTPVGAQFLVKVFVKQKLRGAPHLHQHVPLECTFLNTAHQVVSRTGVVSGEQTTLEFQLPFAPKFTWVNATMKLNIARADFQKTVTATGSVSGSPAKMDVQVNTLPDSTLLRIEYNFAMPDTASANPFNYKISNRYWTVFGDWPAGFDATGKVFYDGRGQLDQLDTELFTQTSPSEDSIRVLYRSGAGQPWQEWPTYTKNTLGSATNKYGSVQILHLQPGQYTFAKGISTVPTQEPGRTLIFPKATPNPADSVVKITASEVFELVQIYNAAGIQMGEWKSVNSKELRIPVQDFPAGQYWAVVLGKAVAGTVSVVVR